jgi:predicted dehydrogenase
MGERTAEIARIARENGIRTAVGLQGRYSRINARVAELVGSGTIGKVLSTTVTGTVPTGDGKGEKAGIKYSLDGDSGATMLDIHFGHFMEGLTHILGRVKRVNGVVATQHPTTSICGRCDGRGPGNWISEDCTRSGYHEWHVIVRSSHFASLARWV